MAGASVTRAGMVSALPQELTAARAVVFRATWPLASGLLHEDVPGYSFVRTLTGVF
jgi:hypothetical protein